MSLKSLLIASNIFVALFINIQEKITSKTPEYQIVKEGNPSSLLSKVYIEHESQQASLKKIADITPPPSQPSTTPTSTLPKQTSPTLTATQINPAPRQNQSDSQLVSETNTYRQQHGIPPIKTRDDICQIVHNRISQVKTEFSHQGFSQLLESNQLSHLGYQRIAENIWQGEPASTQQVINGWDNSDSHRQNMQADWTWGCGILDSNTAVFIYMK